jgi:hypothetical protein
MNELTSILSAIEHGDPRALGQARLAEAEPMVVEGYKGLSPPNGGIRGRAHIIALRLPKQ